MDVPSGSKRPRIHALHSTESSESEEGAEARPNGGAEAAELRRVVTTVRAALDRDSAFGRARLQLCAELDGLLAAHPSTDALAGDDLFRLFESLDDTLDAFIDLDQAHMAVLRHNALQLSAFAALEVLEPREGVPVEERENEESDPIPVPTPTIPKKSKKKGVEEAAKPKSKKKEEVACSAAAAVATRFSAKADAKSATPDPKPRRGAANGRPAAERDEAAAPRKGSVELRSKRRRDASPAASARGDSEEKRSAAEANESDAEREEAEAGRKTRRNGERAADRPKKAAAAKARKPPSPEVEKPRRRAAALAAAAASASDARAATAAAQRRARLHNQEANADEQTYCLCDQISYGQMIGCDNERCTIEWFHFECVDIKAKPAKGVKWFCPLCRGDKSTLLKPGLRR